MTSLSFFGFLADFEQTGGRIPNTEFVKGMFSVIVAFCYTKPENRTTYYDMLLMIEKGIRGGICQATHRYAKAKKI